MAGLSVRDIKNKIKSITNTSQITKSMELVSSVKLRYAKEAAEKIKSYYDIIQEEINTLLVDMDVNEVYKNDSKNDLYVVITGDRGLCGAYNTAVQKLVMQQISDKSKAVILSIGKKGGEFFKSRDYNVKETYVDIIEKPNFLSVKEVIKSIVDGYQENEYSNIYVVYTEFVSSISFVPSIVRLFPVPVDDSFKKSNYVEYEASKEEVFNVIMPMYLQGVMYSLMSISSASEQASRRMAMENATENAKDMLGELSLEYNKARQANITKELTEIVSGAESLK